MFQNKKFFQALLLVIVLSILTSCASTPSTGLNTPKPENQPIESAPSNGSTPITTHMTLSGLPVLNESVDITLVTTTVRDAPGTEINLLLPEDAKLLEGELHWSGDLLVDQPVTIKATIQFTTLGNKEIIGKALSTVDNGDTWGDAAHIYFHITDDGSYEGFSTQEDKDSTDSTQNNP